jgi:hypothetical protein
MLRNEEGVRTEGWSLCPQIRRLLQFEWEVFVWHMYRGANICAYVLAQIECRLGFNVIF